MTGNSHVQFGGGPMEKELTDQPPRQRPTLPSRLPASIVGFAAMPRRRWSKRRVVSSGCVVIQRFFRFEGVGGAKWSTNASACAIPTMRTRMVARGKAVRSAVRSGRHEMTKRMRKTRSIGQNIERWWKVNEVQIPGTKNAL